MAEGLLERNEDLARLEALVSRTVAGDAGVAIVEGPAGIGKSRLLVETRRMAAAAGLVVLWARAGELERDFSFGVVRQLFEPSVAAGGDTLVAGAARAASPVFEVDAEVEADGFDPSFATMHGLYWLAVNLAADQPLLIGVDDLHWCDLASLRFLAYLVRRLEGLPVLVVASLRPAQPGVDDSLIAEIAGDPLTTSIQPRPLSTDAAAALVRDHLGEDAAPAFAAACHSTTGGNPLLLHELLRALAGEGVTPDAAHVSSVADLGPAAVARAVLLRLRRLSPAAVKLAGAIAVLGDGADLATAAPLAGVTVDEAAAAALALVHAEILRPDRPGSFVHPLIGAAVYDDLPPFVRAAEHERAAAILEATGAPVEQVAAHLKLAPARGDRRVVDTLVRASRMALQKGAAEHAVGHLARALAEPPPPDGRCEVLLELGRAEALTSGPAAAEHLADAYRLLGDEDPEAQAAVAQTLARTLLFTGQPEEGAVVAQQAAGRLGDDPRHRDLRLALEAFELLAVLFGAGDPSDLRRLHAHRADRPPADAGVGAKMLAAMAAQEWMYAGGPADEVSALSLAALAGGDLIAADNGLLATCAITNLVFADREEAVDAWEVARVDAHRRGSLFAVSSLDLWFGVTLLWRGELADAEGSLRAALDEFRLWGYGRDQAEIYCDAFLADVQRERGQLAAARATLASAKDAGGVDDGSRYWLNSHIGLLLAERRFDDVLAACDDYAERFDALVRNPMDAPWRSQKATALQRLGRVPEALALVEEEVELAHAWGAPGTVARSLRSLASVSSPTAAVEVLEEAVATVAGSPARLESARCLTALGGALRRAGRQRAAREPLRAAVELATACDAGPVAEEARAELNAAGGRPAPATLTGPASLTASERRVAALAAEGAGNRDIAQALFVTPKTVEAHLSSVYRKLGIRSRRELPGALDGA